MFKYIFWYEVNQWFLNDIAQKIWKILGFPKMINSHCNWSITVCSTHPLRAIYVHFGHIDSQMAHRLTKSHNRFTEGPKESLRSPQTDWEPATLTEGLTESPVICIHEGWNRLAEGPQTDFELFRFTEGPTKLLRASQTNWESPSSRTSPQIHRGSHRPTEIHPCSRKILTEDPHSPRRAHWPAEGPRDWQRGV